MPITVTAAHGVLTERGTREIVPRLTEVLGEITGINRSPAGNGMIGGTIHILDKEAIYAGGEPAPLLVIELKLPAVALDTQQTRAEFIAQATEAAAELTVPGHAVDDIWINILHAADGAWGIGGNSLTNAALQAALA